MSQPQPMRLDQRLLADGLVGSRSRARDLILRGFVHVDGVVCERPAQTVQQSERVALTGNAPGYVSRGAEKLVSALDAFGFDPAGKTVLDAGASTGGFTQVLLERGAARVYAADVGHGQLHEAVRGNGRVVTLENCDVRQIDAAVIGEPLQAIVADLSFISLTKALGGVLQLASPHAFLVALIKPQFELTPQDIGKGGIVRDEAARLRAIESVRAFLGATPDWHVKGVMPSPITGGSGNLEFLLGAVKDG